MLKRVAALGFFDGVHLGHQAILRLASLRAKQLGITSCAVSFNEHPFVQINGTEKKLLVSNLNDKTFYLKKYGLVDEVFFLEFNKDIMNMPFELFFKDILVDKYKICHVVFGKSYTCGKNKLGNLYTIPSLCHKLSIGFDIVPDVKKYGFVISSTLIRQLLACGNTLLAKEFLGHSI